MKFITIKNNRTIFFAACFSILCASICTALPDLTLDSSKILFSDLNPETNQRITIMIEVSNNGNDYGSQVNPTSVSEFTEHEPNDSYPVHGSVWLGQYFVAAETFYLGKVSLLISNQGDTTDEAILQIRNDDPNSLYPKPVDGASNLLGTSHTTCTESNAVWQDFTFDIPIEITQGETYWLCMGSTSSVINRYRWWLGENTNPDMIAMSINQGNSWYDVDATNNGQETLAGFYEVFKTYETVISLYDGDPQNNGRLINIASILKPVNSNESSTILSSWTPDTAGEHTLYI
ncbi:MAG: choice-of-anchor R domain-containing protein, partial [bacterium]